MKLILLGPPGAGKGTHARILSEKYRAPHLATGEILRQQIRAKTPLGLKAKGIIEKGGLVPDQLVNEMMFEEMRRTELKNGFILDGFPRTLGQAEALEYFLAEEKTKPDAVLNFVTSEKVIIDRLSGRRVCSSCGANYHIRNIPPRREGICDQCGQKLVQRKDDEPEAIKYRFQMYEKETKPLIDFYGKRNLLQDVPGDYDIPELETELALLFEKLKIGK